MKFVGEKFYKTRGGQKAQIFMLDHKTLLEILDYDKNSGTFVWKVKPSYRIHSGTPAGYKNCRGYVVIVIKKKNYLAHRLAWFYVHEKWPNNQIDHINGVTTDNHICNLREATARENSTNKKIHRAGKLPGCTYNTRCKKWHAQIQINGKMHSLKYHNTEQEAHHAYLKALGELK